MRRLLRLALELVIIVGLGMWIRSNVFCLVRIAGTSMENTLTSGDVALVTRADYRFGGSPNRGDVVECAFPGRDGRYVKRVIGLPGDIVEFKGGVLLLNGRCVSEPYVISKTDDFCFIVGDGEYFVMGDNRAESYDSRAADMGCLTRECFLGRVRLILWPLNRFGIVE